MSGAPLVSVVMAVWNDARWLSEAIESVLAQSLRELELVVVDDGSTDETPRILEAFGRRDSRVRLVHQGHAGLPAALNRGLKVSRGELIARLDADDLALPGRLERQVEYLRQHPGVVIAGSDVEKIDECGSVTARAKRPPSDEAIRFKALLWCPFTHSAVMMRRAVLEKHGLRYDEGIRGSEDYELWTRLLEHGRGGNLPDALVRYRVRSGFSTRNREAFVRIAASIGLRTIRRWLPGYRTDEAEVLRMIGCFAGMGRAKLPSGPEGLALANRYLDLYEAFAATREPGPELAELGRFEAGRFLEAFRPSLTDAAWLELVGRLHRVAPDFPHRFLARWAPELRRESLRSRAGGRAELADALLGAWRRAVRLGARALDPRRTDARSRRMRVAAANDLPGVSDTPPGRPEE